MPLTLYQRLNPSGTVRQQCAGVGLEKAGDNAFRVTAAHLGGLVPRAGDRLVTADGKAFTVGAVGEPADGEYPLTVEPEGGGA